MKSFLELAKTCEDQQRKGVVHTPAVECLFSFYTEICFGLVLFRRTVAARALGLSTVCGLLTFQVCRNFSEIFFLCYCQKSEMPNCAGVMRNHRALNYEIQFNQQSVAMESKNHSLHVKSIAQALYTVECFTLLQEWRRGVFHPVHHHAGLCGRSHLLHGAQSGPVQ